MWIAHSRVCIQSGIQLGVYHTLYIRRVEPVSTRVRYPVRSGVTSGVQQTYTCIRQRQSVSVHYYLLCQRIPIATCNRRILYYAYHTRQSRS